MTMKKALFAACAMGALVLATPALAQTEYHIAGNFLPAAGTPLGGGSFEGIYTLSGDAFPTSGVGYFDSFSINFRDSLGNVLLTLAEGVNDGWGYINTDAASYYGGIPIYFYDQQGQDYLHLIVPVGFSGMGAGIGNGPSFAQIGSPANQGIISSAVIGVPEPAAWGLMIGGFGLMGAALRTRRTKVAYA
jgi:hypothetical protein